MQKTLQVAPNRNKTHQAFTKRTNRYKTLQTVTFSMQQQRISMQKQMKHLKTTSVTRPLQNRYNSYAFFCLQHIEHVYNNNVRCYKHVLLIC